MKRGLSYKIANLKYSIIDFFHNHKIKVFICGFCLILGILTGIFTAVKMVNTDATELFEAFNITDSIGDIEKFNENFFGRLVSYEIVSILLLVFAQTKVTQLFGFCLISYRSFLVSINCVMLVIVYSYGGILKSLLIILPCQVLMLIVLCLYFCHSRSVACERTKYKFTKVNDYYFPFLVVSILLTLVNLIETLLLFVFKSSVILVI